MTGIFSYTAVKTEKLSTNQSLEVLYLQPLQYSRSHSAAFLTHTDYAFFRSLLALICHLLTHHLFPHR